MPVAPRPKPYATFAVEYFVAGKLCVNTYNYTTAIDPVSTAVLQAASDAFAELVTTSFVPALAPDVLIEDVHASYYNDADTLDTFTDIGVNGGSEGDSLPGPDVVELQWHVDRVPGRRLTRGKSYISGVGEGDADTGRVRDPALGFLTTFAESVRTFPGVDSLSDLVFSIYSPRDGTWGTCTAVTIDTLFKTLRRRRTSS